MKKIVFFSGGIDRSGGIERVLSIVASGLAKSGYDVTIVSMCGEKRSHYELDVNVKTLFMEASDFSKNIHKNIKKLSGIIDSIEPDYWVDVDIILSLYTYFVRKKHKNVKWISWEHFNYFYDFPYYRLLRRIARKIACSHADCIVVLSREDEGYYKENKKIKGRIVSIYNPIPYEVSDETFEKKKTVLAAGRLVKIKGFDLLIDAWNKIEKDNPDWKLVIAGEGEERQELEKRIENYGLKNVTLTGFIDEMQNLYREASVFALSSKCEGFVMTLLEALSFGVPCVAFSCKAGVKEIIEDGINGYLVTPEDTDEFAEKLSSLMNNDEIRSRMSENCKPAARKFSPEIIIEKWIELLNSL